jgi:hypothetical protein
MTAKRTKGSRSFLYIKMNCTLIAHIAQRQQTANPFGSTFAFFANSQAKQKNAKELPSNRTKTAVNIDRQATTERTPACNSTYKKLAVRWLIEALFFVSSLVLADSFELRNPLLRQAPKR